MPREAYAHEAVVSMAEGQDEAAIGAAVTVALCGHWEHDGPCPLAPHHTAAQRDGDEVRVRILFAVEAAREGEVRERVGAALASGRLTGPGGRESRWTLRDARPSAVRPDEADHASRLASNG